MEFGGERHAPDALPLWKSSGTHCKGVRGGLRACLDAYGEEKNFMLPPAFEHRPCIP